jgi:hypothetical protein
MSLQYPIIHTTQTNSYTPTNRIQARRSLSLVRFVRRLSSIPLKSIATHDSLSFARPFSSFSNPFLCAGPKAARFHCSRSVTASCLMLFKTTLEPDRWMTTRRQELGSLRHLHEDGSMTVLSSISTANVEYLASPLFVNFCSSSTRRDGRGGSTIRPTAPSVGTTVVVYVTPLAASERAVLAAADVAVLFTV